MKNYLFKSIAVFGLLIGVVILGSFTMHPRLPTITTVTIDGCDDAGWDVYSIKVEIEGIEYYTQLADSHTVEVTGPRDPEWFNADFIHRASYVAYASVWVKYSSLDTWNYLGKVVSTDSGVSTTISNGKLYFMDFHLDIFLNP